MPPVVQAEKLSSSSGPNPNLSHSRFTGKRIHFIGAGGSGMSGLARMLLDSGAIVTGSEPKPGATTFELIQRGAKISRDQVGELLSKEIDLVVRTAAVPDTNSEFQIALRLGLKHIKYAQLLGLVMQERLGIAVAGTHGKSTTTAMLSYALLKNGADPSFVVGGTVPQLGGGSRSGAGRAFVAEACEYDRSFHNLRPTMAIVTNIDADHLDVYKDLDDIVSSFRHFAELLPENGLIITLGADPTTARAFAGLKTSIQTVALATTATADWTVYPTPSPDGYPTADIAYRGSPVASLHLSVPGTHNLLNATMAIAAAHAACGLAPRDAATAINDFTGVDRRMSVIGTYNGATVIDDYGHHPTEIRATLAALQQRYKPTRLICVFQPHQASRTRLLLNEFATAFVDADEVILPDIYFVRDSDEDKAAVSSPDLVRRITHNGQHAVYLPSFPQILTHLKQMTGPGDLVVTMGAGPIWEVSRDLVG
jgi:UDP-N-acetylmuramate--alanine ligase